MTAASTPTQSCKRERGMDDAPLIATLMPPTQIFKRNREGNDASPGVDPRKLLELHVQDTNGMWLVMPRNLSDRLLESWRSGENLKVVYLGDWEGARACYVIDFATMCQRKFQPKCEYRIKIVEVLAKGAATE